MSAVPPGFVTVAIVYSQSELAVLLSMLRFYGHRPICLSGHHSAVDWPMTLALGGIRVAVHGEEAADVRALLAGVERGCPQAAIFSDRPAMDRLLMLLLFVGGLFLPPARMPADFLPGPDEG